MDSLQLQSFSPRHLGVRGDAATGRVWARVSENGAKAWNAVSMCRVCFVNPTSMREQDMAHVCAVCVGATGAG